MNTIISTVLVLLGVQGICDHVLCDPSVFCHLQIECKCQLTVALGQDEVKPLYPDYPDYPLLPKQVINEKSLLRKCFGSSNCASVSKCEKKCASWVPGNRFGDLKSFGCQSSPQKCCCEYEQKKKAGPRAQFDTCLAQPVCQPDECENQCADYGTVEKSECTSADTCCCKLGPANDGSDSKCFEASDQCASGACEAKCDFYMQEWSKGPVKKAKCEPQGPEKFKCCCTFDPPPPATEAPIDGGPDGTDGGPDGTGDGNNYYY